MAGGATPSSGTGGVAAGAVGGAVGGAARTPPRVASSASPGRGGAVFEQPARPMAAIPRMAAAALARAHRKALVMWVILLEALLALALLVFIVWWTMFAGRRKGERLEDETDAPD